MKTKPEKTTPSAKAPKIPDLQSQLTDLKARQEAAKKRLLGAKDAHKRAKRAFKLAKRDAKAVRRKVKAVKRALKNVMVAVISRRTIPTKKPAKPKTKAMRASKTKAEPIRPTTLAAPEPVAGGAATRGGDTPAAVPRK